MSAPEIEEPSTGRPAPAPAAASARIALSSSGEEILRAVAPVLLGSLLPAQPAARSAALESGMALLDDYLAHFSLPLQQQTRIAFAVLTLLPVRLMLLGTCRRWRSVDPARIEAFLRNARSSRVALLRQLFALLQSMAVIAWFDQPDAWAAIGYPGPPIERPQFPEAAS